MSHPQPWKNEVIVEIEGMEEMLALPAEGPDIHTTTEEEVRTKQADPPPPHHHHQPSIPSTEDEAQRTVEIQSWSYKLSYIYVK